MDTRILTLFDDDFFPPEKPKEKPKKEKASTPLATSDSEEANTGKKDTDVIAEALNEFHQKESIEKGSADNAAEEKTVIIESVAEEIDTTTSIIIDDVTDQDNIAIDETQAVIDIQASSETSYNELKDATAESIEELTDEAELIQSMQEEDDTIEEADVKEEEEAETTTEMSSSANEDKELNKQILSELIQLDYTALMQKDYAFDLNHATVINKELPKQKPQQDKVISVKNIEEEEEEEVFEDVTPLPEWKLDKKYYTIGEVATLFEVNTSHIRFWTNEFKLRPRTTRKGDRLYSPKDIAELRLIHHLVKVKKHTIKGAKEKLKAEKSDVNNKLDLKESLVQLKDTLLKIREQL